MTAFSDKMTFAAILSTVDWIKSIPDVRKHIDKSLFFTDIKYSNLIIRESLRGSIMLGKNTVYFRKAEITK